MTDLTNPPALRPDDNRRDFSDLLKGLPEGPWAYRPYKHDDWGWVRGKSDAAGFAPILAYARLSYLTDAQLNEHRHNKTDPYEKLARAIAAIPDMLAEIERLTDVSEALKSLLEVRDIRIRALESEINRLRAEAAQHNAEPLPDEVAALIKRLLMLAAALDACALDHPYQVQAYERADIRQVAAVLQQMAQRNGELEQEINEALQLTESCSTLKDMASACIDGAVFKAERDKLSVDLAAMKKWALDSDETNDRVRAERDQAIDDLQRVRSVYDFARLTAQRDKLRETLSAMWCPHQMNAGTIADCTGRNECYCKEGAVFVKTGDTKG